MGGRRWGDHRDWPHVPDDQLAALLDDAQVQVERLGQTWVNRLGMMDNSLDLSPVVGALSSWAQGTVEMAASDGPSASHARARARLVQWGTHPGRRWPDEAWWWSPCGLVVTAWSEPGHWERHSAGQVRQYVSAGEAARHLPVSPRTVRRWGENRKRVRQRGTATDGRQRMLHRTDLAQLVVMRYRLLFR